MYKVWIGNRESEILTYNIFDESITFYGSNKLNNSSFDCQKRVPSNYGNEFKLFVIEKIQNIIARYTDVEFHFYNPKFAHKIISTIPWLSKYFVNINTYETLKWITSKTFVREWMSNSIVVPPYALLSKKECNISNLQSIFGQYDNFIVQKDISGGGEGTFLFNANSETEINSILSDYGLLLISPYLSPKISICCHMLIDGFKPYVFPFGIQKSKIIDNKLIYKGTNYFDGISIKNDLLDSARNMAIAVGNNLKNINYRGICGLDFIIYNSKIYFIEVNARYLGSSFLINKALKEQELPSLFELNSMCFKSQIPNNLLDNYKVKYASNTEKSNCTLEKEAITDMIKKQRLIHESEIYYDGLENTEHIESNTYLFRELFSDN